LKSAINRKQDKLAEIDAELDAAADRFMAIGRALEMTGDTCTMSSIKAIQRNFRIFMLARRVKKRLMELK